MAEGLAKVVAFHGETRRLGCQWIRANVVMPKLKWPSSAMQLSHIATLEGKAHPAQQAYQGRTPTARSDSAFQ